MEEGLLQRSSSFFMSMPGCAGVAGCEMQKAVWAMSVDADLDIAFAIKL